MGISIILSPPPPSIAYSLKPPIGESFIRLCSQVEAYFACQVELSAGEFLRFSGSDLAASIFTLCFCFFLNN